jgi:hypothetical protein
VLNPAPKPPTKPKRLFHNYHKFQAHFLSFANSSIHAASFSAASTGIEL